MFLTFLGIPMTWKSSKYLSGGEGAMIGAIGVFTKNGEPVTRLELEFPDHLIDMVQLSKEL